MLYVLEFVYMHPVCAEAACAGGHKKASNALELQLQIVVNCLVCAGSQSCVLCTEVRGQAGVSSFLLPPRAWSSGNQA